MVNLKGRLLEHPVWEMRMMDNIGRDGVCSMTGHYISTRLGHLVKRYRGMSPRSLDC